ncbi:MAG: hypothetical protein ACE147_02670 [Candidatus Methylomirabilales bacterium]
MAQPLGRVSAALLVAALVLWPVALGAAGISGSGPVIFSVSPGASPPGATTVVLLRGHNLKGVTAVQALREGTPDTYVTTASFHSNPDGTTLTCTIVISQSAAPGARILQVVTRYGRSAGFDTGANRFTVER